MVELVGGILVRAVFDRSKAAAAAAGCWIRGRGRTGRQRRFVRHKTGCPAPSSLEGETFIKRQNILMLLILRYVHGARRIADGGFDCNGHN